MDATDQAGFADHSAAGRRLPIPTRAILTSEAISSPRFSADVTTKYRLRIVDRPYKNPPRQRFSPSLPSHRFSRTTLAHSPNNHQPNQHYLTTCLTATLASLPSTVSAATASLLRRWARSAARTSPTRSTSPPSTMASVRTVSLTSASTRSTGSAATASVPLRLAARVERPSPTRFTSPRSTAA